MAGPLKNIRIIEFAGIGPGPFCGMMLADHGAEVIRIDRIGGAHVAGDPLGRSKKSIAINMKTDEGVGLARELCKSADGLIEGFRPGVMEKLGLGPDVLLGDNPDMIYGRMTGWGQTGPLAHAAGHDINYIALSGVLHTCGRRGEKPTPPVNYLGDFGGGGLMLAFAMTGAILNVKNGGEGQVVDCAMTEGSALLATMTYGFLNNNFWRDQPGVNIIDTGAHFYDTYETKDGRWVAIGSIEPQFYGELREKAGLKDSAFDKQMDQNEWPALKEKLAELFKMKTRDEWDALLAGTDVCYAPVLSMTEAPDHPHNRERGSFVDVNGAKQPAPAPRYSSTENNAPAPSPQVGSNATEILALLNKSDDEIAALREAGVIG
ncbi:MAG: CoA transferase [Marinicaulis sp.]|nr:CoA transferase [Marinicaulis sp.]